MIGIVVDVMGRRVAGLWSAAAEAWDFAVIPA